VTTSAIVVVGSINMDLAVRCPHVPVPGETILGSSLLESPGGKGANQAVAAGRLGGSVAMVGCVGHDGYGAALRASLAKAGVAVDRVIARGDRSGVALIAVGDHGENSIVVVPGANALVTPGDVEAALDTMSDARMVLLQLELPLPTVQAAARAAHARGLQVLLDPAPAQPLPGELLQDVDILLPNQGEAGLLARLPVVSLVEARDAARRLLTRGPRTVLIKLGADGVLIVDAAGDRHVAGHRVATVDTTAAGDCLAGALAVALIEGQPLDRAVAFANAAAALSTTRPGAQDSMPSRPEVDALLAGP
jgi:ribokinase